MRHGVMVVKVHVNDRDEVRGQLGEGFEEILFLYESKSR